MEFTITTWFERQPHTRPQASRLKGRWIALALLALLHFAGPCSISAQGTPSNEYVIKAAFLFHFAQFVEWPESAFQDANSPLIYCTIGEDPFHGVLDDSLKGKVIGGRTFQVRHLRQIQDAQACHLIFVSSDDKRQTPGTLAVLQGNPILTVGESERFVQEGGVIGFCMEENKIRFQINLEAADKANLRISSRLLTLAKTVIGKAKRD